MNLYIIIVQTVPYWITVLLGEGGHVALGCILASIPSERMTIWETIIYYA